MDFDLLLSLAGVFFPSAIQGSTGYAEAGSKQQRETKQHLIVVACLGRTGRTGSRPNSIVGLFTIANYRKCVATGIYVVSDVYSENDWKLGWEGNDIKRAVGAVIDMIIESIR